jgi:putative flippase GtrA
MTRKALLSSDHRRRFVTEQRDISRQFVIFSGIGISCTLLQYLILIVLVIFARITPVVASSIGYLISALSNYLLNRRYTFYSSVSHIKAVPRFVLTMLCGLALNAGVLWIVIDGFGWHYLVCQIVSSTTVLAFNFFASRLWTFSNA